MTLHQVDQTPDPDTVNRMATSPPSGLPQSLNLLLNYADGLHTTTKWAGNGWQFEAWSPWPVYGSYIKAWKALPLGQLLGLVVAQGPDLHLTASSAALLELAGLTVRLSSQGQLMLDPGASRGKEAWVLAPGPENYQALEDARAKAIDASCPGAGNRQVAAAAVDKWLKTIVTEQAEAWGVELPETPGGKVLRREQATWFKLAKARAGADAKLGLVLEREEDNGWSISACLVADGKQHPLTQEPLLPERPDLAVSRLLEVEAEELSLSWPDCPLVEYTKTHLGKKAGFKKAPIPATTGILEDLASTGLASCGRTGIGVWIDGTELKLARNAGARIRKRRRDEGSGLLKADDLGLKADLTVDGQQLTGPLDVLTQVGGQWVALTGKQLAKLTRLAKTTEGGIDVTSLLVDEMFEGVEVDPEVFTFTTKPVRVPQPAGFAGVLRGYQRDGLDWLTWLEKNQLGGILADDMGLGKTVQVLARIQEDHPGPTLVVAPLGLLTNWKMEAEKFTPELRVVECHGPDRADALKEAPYADIVLTTYTTLTRTDGLRTIGWHRVVADEAQNVKNPDTAAAKALRSLTATSRLAVTGTPVENNVQDLWSIMAFAVPGLLGRRGPFLTRYGQEGAQTQTLKAGIAPYVLRRVKTDDTLELGLPEREIVKVPCPLTAEQVDVYEKEHRRMLTGLAGAKGLGRKSSILAGLTRLKQTCVHPILVPRGRSQHEFPGRSGKIDTLDKLLMEQSFKGEAVVVFTQFASILPQLAAHLSAILGVEVLRMDGKTARKDRDLLLARFAEKDGPPVLLCSLKTGGVGLNLVRAQHVVHLDRWWNPAVEDQASDRVWRIGQDENVTVHLLVCPGTLEDRIDTLLERKRALAGQVVGGSETALSEMTDSELEQMVRLVKENLLS